MPFTEAIRTCLANYAVFTGRATRPEFWWFALFNFLVIMVAGALHPQLAGIAMLALLLPGVAASARRLHDVGKSGWFLLLHFIPFFGNLVLLYWLVQPTDGPNQFGIPAVTPYSRTVMPGGGSR
jgi:uncharacterized membrane protein YhaH (DUF805 family)